MRKRIALADLAVVAIAAGLVAAAAAQPDQPPGRGKGPFAGKVVLVQYRTGRPASH